jgi:hypothetical protein
MAIHMRR